MTAMSFNNTFGNWKAKPSTVWLCGSKRMKNSKQLFYGGASGTFQDFCMVKYDGVKWMSVPCDWNPDEDADNIKLGKNQQHIGKNRSGSI